jgi:hypothetical protein
MPQFHGKCPECKAKFFIDRHQEVFHTAIVTAAQHAVIKTLDRLAESTRDFGITSEDMSDATRRARKASDPIKAVQTYIGDLIARQYPAFKQSVPGSGFWSCFVATIDAARARLTEDPSVAPITLVECLQWRSSAGDRAWSPGDIVWGVLNQRLLRAQTTSEQRSLSLTMATWLRHEHKPNAHILRVFHQLDCRTYADAGVTRVRVNGGFPDCRASRMLHGQQFSIADAIRKSPIPHTDCERDKDPDSPSSPAYCACCLTAVIDGDGETDQ